MIIVCFSCGASFERRKLVFSINNKGYKHKKIMKQIDVEVSATISMKYDPESEEFKAALESYRDAIEDSANEEDMLRQIAWYITTFDTENMIEGIGYVSVDGKKNGDPETGTEWILKTV